MEALPRMNECFGSALQKWVLDAVGVYLSLSRALMTSFRIALLDAIIAENSNTYR